MNTTILVMSDVTIRKAHLLRAYDALLAAAEHNDGKHRFPPHSTIAHAGELKLALGSYGLHFEENAAGSLMNLTFRSERADNTREVLAQAFEAIGPYVVAGHAAIFTSENAEVFRFYFDGTQCVVQDGYAAFKDAPVAPPEEPADRLSEVAPEPRPWLVQAGEQDPDAPMGSGLSLRAYAESADTALRAYAVRTGLSLPDEYEEAVKDALTGIMHVCDREDLDFEAMLDSAQRRYNEEIDGDG